MNSAEPCGMLGFETESLFLKSGVNGALGRKESLNGGHMGEQHSEY
jgi:hypothetical protein